METLIQFLSTLFSIGSLAVVVILPAVIFLGVKYFVEKDVEKKKKLKKWILILIFCPVFLIIFGYLIMLATRGIKVALR